MSEKITDIHHWETRSADAGGFYVHGTNLSKTQKSKTYTGSAVWKKIPNQIKEAQSLTRFQVKQTVIAMTFK